MLKKAPTTELSYILGRYGGPYNVILREKVYDWDVCDDLTRLLNDELAYRALEDIMLVDDK